MSRSRGCPSTTPTCSGRNGRSASSSATGTARPSFPRRQRREKRRRLRPSPASNLALAMRMTNASPRDTFYRRMFNEILKDLGAVTVPDLRHPGPALILDLSRSKNLRTSGHRYDVTAEDSETSTLRFTLNPMAASPPRQADHLDFPCSPSARPFPDAVRRPLSPQTLAICDVENGIHFLSPSPSRVNPRLRRRTLRCTSWPFPPPKSGLPSGTPPGGRTAACPAGRPGLAVAGTDGTRAVNVIVHDSIRASGTSSRTTPAPYATTEDSRPTPPTRSAWPCYREVASPPPPVAAPLQVVDHRALEHGARGGSWPSGVVSLRTTHRSTSTSASIPRLLVGLPARTPPEPGHVDPPAGSPAVAGRAATSRRRTPDSARRGSGAGRTRGPGRARRRPPPGSAALTRGCAGRGWSRHGGTAGGPVR